jgi:hypothetical protein
MSLTPVIELELRIYSQICYRILNGVNVLTWGPGDEANEKNVFEAGSGFALE